MPNDSNRQLKLVQKEISGWVASVFPPDYPKCFPPRGSEKIVREAVLGYHVLQPYECVILDSPMVQRLRYIHQNALAYLVYPTATHTRFDHSLGVAKIAEQIGRTIGLPHRQIVELRIAGLLHDVGHCLFSHLSEKLIKQKFAPSFQAIREDPLFADCKVHELLSYLIIKSPTYTKFLQKVFDYYGLSYLSVDNISRIIIGKPQKPEQFAYMGDIVHGPFDADKLDYLVRDCYFTGIRADVDVDRAIISCEKLLLSKFAGYPHANLIMKYSGVSNLEQTVLNKILLFSAIYHHHKVRSLECMARSIFETIWEDPDKIVNVAFRFNRITDFLKISELDFFSLGQRESAIASQITNLLNRQLLKRCLIVSPNYITENSQYGQHDIYKLGDEHPEQIRLLREMIWDEISRTNKTSIHDLWVDFPDPPNIDEDVDRCFIDVGTKQLKQLKDFLPYGEWLDTYGANKWRGHVFYVPGTKHRKAANKAAKAVFKELLSVEFDPAASNLCKF